MPMTDAQKKGNSCEKLAREKYESQGYHLIRLQKGGDWLAIKQGAKPEIVEAKCGNSSLTSNEKSAKQLAKRIGLAYTVVRCVCR